jgi:hypothetical protein
LGASKKREEDIRFKIPGGYPTFPPGILLKGTLKEDKTMFSFWKKSKSGLLGPKELPNPVGRNIVRYLGGDPDKTWDLKAVMRPKEGYQDIFEVRVFDGAQAASKKITVKDYNSLTENPELILYDGWYSTKGEAEIKKR